MGSNKTKCSRRKDHAAVSGRYRWRWWSGTRALALHYISRSELSGSIGDAYEPRVSDIKYAFLYGTHKRLGAKSYVLMLPVDVIGEIFSFLFHSNNRNRNVIYPEWTTSSLNRAR